MSMISGTETLFHHGHAAFGLKNGKKGMNEGSDLSVPANTELPALVEAAKADRKKAASLLSRYMPFIKKCAGEVFFKREAREEHLSEAMLGFLQSVNTYKKESGAFIPYARTVIHNRLINAFHKESVFKKRFDKSAEAPVLASQRQYELSLEREALHNETEILGGEIKSWGFDFESLSKHGARQKRTRAACMRIARTALAVPEIAESIRKTQQIPVKKLMALTGCKEKIFEKYRRYIAALFIILSGDYPYIRSFLPAIEEAEQ
jgi:RNA polymerase sigma factor